MNCKKQARRIRSILQRGCIFVVALLLAASVRGADEPKSPAAAGASTVTSSSLWQKIVLIGASATAGFTASEPFGGTNTPKYALSRYVDAALTVPHEPAQNLGNAFFFLQPQLLGQQQIARALTNHPTLVIGVDFPFWFCYGAGETDNDRLQRFEGGLKLLEAIPCPLVIGDIPDASAAVNGMLRPDQIPTPQAILKANERLKAWAATRRNVALVALSDFMRNAMANRPITVRSYTLPAGQTRILIQNDALHPTPPGCSVLALAALDAIQPTRPNAGPVDFICDPKDIFRKGLKSVAPASPTNSPSATK